MKRSTTTIGIVQGPSWNSSSRNEICWTTLAPWLWLGVIYAGAVMAFRCVMN